MAYFELEFHKPVLLAHAIVYFYKNEDSSLRRLFDVCNKSFFHARNNAVCNDDGV